MNKGPKTGPSNDVLAAMTCVEVISKYEDAVKNAKVFLTRFYASLTSVKARTSYVQGDRYPYYFQHDGVIEKFSTETEMLTCIWEWLLEIEAKEEAEKKMKYTTKNSPRHLE